MEKTYCVYILASGRYGTLYTGVTSDLVKRAWQHREKLVDGFTKKYDVEKLVWYELHEDVIAAITREKQIKKWNRAWKINMIQQQNPLWEDLYDAIVG
jgi:putative endonuclease